MSPAQDQKSATACAKCGACLVVCPVYRQSRNEIHSARGKLHLLDVLGLDGHGPVFEEIFTGCLLCGACSERCPRGIDITELIRSARGAFPAVHGGHGYEKYLARKVLESPRLLKGLAKVARLTGPRIAVSLPADSGLRLRLGIFERGVTETDGPTVEKTAGEGAGRLLCFNGCSFTHLYPEISKSTQEVCERFGYELAAPDKLRCCGLAADSAGDRQTAAKLARQNITALEEEQGPILVPCASCYSALVNYPNLFADEPQWHQRAVQLTSRLLEVNSFLSSCLAECRSSRKKSRRKKVYYHHPCHLRFGAAATPPPVELLSEQLGMEMVKPDGDPACCGQGGLFHIGEPELSARIRTSLSTRVFSLEPEIITTSCSGCLMQWIGAVHHRGAPIAVKHPLELVRDFLCSRS
ncbi:MAG: (Fe-S)-binding protein [Thermodesulfobacteriota bacterium]